MSTNLVEQLEEYLHQVEAQQRPITAEEVAKRLGSVTVTKPTRPWNRRGLLVAAAAAVLVLLVGVVPLLFVGGSPAADTSTPTTLSDTTPTTVTVATTEATQAPSTTEQVIWPDPTEASDVFGFPAGVPIRDKVGFDITDTLIYIDRYINAIEQGTPEASFDTDSLGVEEVLVPVEPSNTLGGSTPNTDRDTEQLALWAVSLDGTDVEAQFGAWLEFPTESELAEFEYDANIEFGHNGGGTDHFEPPESLGLLGVSDLGSGFATSIAGLPPEAAVVSTVYGDGTRVWQRPLFGMAVFNNTTRDCRPEPFEGQGCTPMEISVLDSSGTELFALVTPISEADHGYMITMPSGETFLR